MTRTSKERGGSFRELKSHLPLFDNSLHRHDRGWPHPPPQPNERAPKRRWKTIGIFHFRHDEEESG